MTQSDLTLLFSRNHGGQPSVLSVYLDVDQSKQVNLHRRFEDTFKKMALKARKAISDRPERDRFTDAAQHIQEFLEVYWPERKSLAAFYDATDGFFWLKELDFSVPDQARWGSEAFLQPLIAGLDQLENYGVALIDRASWRLFVVLLGRIREIRRHEIPTGSVRHIKTAGTDHSESSSGIQRKADNQIRRHLAGLAKEMDNLAKTEKLRRFILAGTPEITAEFRGLLPTRLRSLVMGEVVLAGGATPAEVLAATRPVADKYEHDTEVEKVNKLVTTAAKKGKAVVGLTNTLKAVNADRVWELLYCDGIIARGYECRECASLFSTRPTRCAYCGARLEPVGNIIERAVEHAMRRHARIEVVTGPANETLKEAGGVGAFLKTRTGTLAA
ncbi:MAG TPA: hypothetical protein VFY29_07025 [Terriglobia bacterium]|nr:hypothetical protein [Terriglobia bacterium]